MTSLAPPPGVGSPAAPPAAPTPPSRERRDGARTAPARRASSPADQRRGHRFPRLALLLLAVLVLAPVAWWVAPLIPWTPPWLQPAGPLVASGTLEADEILVGSE